MPEGDTIFRAASTLQRALAGQKVTEFTSVFPRLTRVEEDSGVVGRSVEGVGGARQVAADAFFGRPDPAHAYADEWKLAHLSSRGKVEAAPG